MGEPEPTTVGPVLLFIAGGIVGVLLGGLLDWIRTRSRWRQELRRHAYALVLRGLKDFGRACAEYVDLIQEERAKPGSPLWNEHEGQVEREARELLQAIDEVALVGSLQMHDRLLPVHDGVMDLRTEMKNDPDSFLRAWYARRTFFSNFPSDFLDMARRQLAASSVRERLQERRRDRKRLKRLRV